MRFALAVVFILLTLPTAAQTIFIEAENCTDNNWGGPAEFKGEVSGDKILRLWSGDALPNGYLARFPFTLRQTAKWHIWVSVSMPDMTSPFWWRIDNGKWKHFGETELGDLNEQPARYGVSGCMAWIRLTSDKLATGAHVLEIRVNERRAMLERAFLLYMDAIIVTTKDGVPIGLVTSATADALKAVPSLKPILRSSKPGPPMLLGTSVMTYPGNRAVKSLGFSLLQTDSDHLTVNETSPGVWDWASSDSGLAACRKAGLDWQYFPHYHWPPAWYRQLAKFVPCMGLKSGKKLPCMSLWSPDILPWFDSGYAALAKHYSEPQYSVAGGSGRRETPVKAIYLGIYGDFGEATYPAGYHPDEAKLFGPEGTAVPDYWCGDEFARTDFSRMALRKYGTAQSVRKAWGLTDDEDIDYPPLAYGRAFNIPATPQSRRRWLDFTDWYYDSMTRFTESVATIARRHFPNAILVVPLGNGDENLVWGQDNTAIPKAMRSTKTQIRSTHGGFTSFGRNMSSMLKRIATAAKFYGLPFWTEPPGSITPDGEVSRFMEAVSSGSWGYWDWGSNPFGAARTFREYKAFLTREKPVVNTALFFPTTDHRLHPEVGYPQHLIETGTALRDVMDFDIVDELLVNDGALKNYRVLIWPEGHYVGDSALKAIEAWVRNGGVLVVIADNGISTVDGDESIGERLIGILGTMKLGASGTVVVANNRFARHLAASTNLEAQPVGDELASSAHVIATINDKPVAWLVNHGKGCVVAWASYGQATVPNRGFLDLCRDAVYRLSALGSGHRDAAEVDTKFDGVYATLLTNGEVILLNDKTESKTVKVGSKTVVLPSHSLRSIAWDQK